MFVFHNILLRMIYVHIKSLLVPIVFKKTYGFKPLIRKKSEWIYNSVSVFKIAVVIV